MSIYACSACSNDLSKDANGQLQCTACKHHFPTLDDVEFLWSEPGSALLDWRNRLNRELAEIEHALQLASVDSSQYGALTQQRMARLTDGYTALLEQLQNILKPLQVGEALAKETHLALQTKLASHHGVLSYAPNIFRDWCWGNHENDAVRDHLIDQLTPHLPTQTQTVLILGGGAGRLAFDLHHILQPEQTISLDANPLLSLVGSLVSAGQTLEMTEFANAPISLEDSAQLRQLAAPHAANPGLKFVCADALRPPFQSGTFDLVVTPWLLDVIDTDLGDLLDTIGGLVKPGGLWVNHGSVAFAGANPGRRLTASELDEFAQTAQFEVVASGDLRLPYLQSPASRQHRTELVFTQVCRSLRTNTPAQVSKQHQLPQWLVQDALPVPLYQTFQTQITTVRVHAFIMSLIDGKRSIGDMANVLEEQRLMPAAQAREAIRQFLSTMHEEAVHASGGNLQL